jgi:pSer/pThr/pTyr-binding forkhead associated (FHA) protein
MGHARGVLVIQNGDFAGTRHELAQDETLIGRNPTTHITLLDEGISREHAIVLRDEQSGAYSIEDLQSTNGTRVNGKRTRSADLSHGDVVEIGRTRFCFLLEPAPER